MSKRVYEESFKKMAVELSNVKGSVKEVAQELGIDPGRLSKWRKKQSQPSQAAMELTSEKQEIKQLKKALKEAELERDILKKAVSIFSKGDGRYLDS